MKMVDKTGCKEPDTYPEQSLRALNENPLIFVRMGCTSKTIEVYM